MFNVLIIDRSNPAFYQLVIHLAGQINHDDVTILFLSDKEKSGKQGNLEVVNVSDIPQSKSLVELQSQYDFSLHKTLVSERAFFDYSSFRLSQRYSDMDLDAVYAAVLPYVNALDYLIRERVDLVIEGLADNFLTSVAGRLVGFYKKKFFMVFVYYWFDSGFLMADRTDQTSTLIDNEYEYYLKHQELLSREQLDAFYSRKVLQPFFPNNYTIKSRLTQFINRFKSYEPLSFKNFLLRRLAWTIAKLQIKAFITFEQKLHGEKFVLFPLHVTPEATLLGSTPELADQFLPAGVYLYVKEHPYQVIGLGLDYQFYKKIKSLPNVRLYGTHISADTMYKDPNCVAITVISGTVGLEAALHKLPVFVFGRAIYSAADCFIKPKDFDDFFRILGSIINKEFRFDEPALYAMLQALKDGAIRADVDFSKARSWLELSYMGNKITAKFIEQQYLEWSKLKPV
jgi:Capsule polysaccharide biosynthesis protein